MGRRKASFLGVAALVVAAPGLAQGTSGNSNTQPLMKGDPNKVVCKKEETIGSRLGARRVCLTIAQWNEKAREHREFTEDVQSGTWGPQSNPALETGGPR